MACLQTQRNRCLRSRHRHSGLSKRRRSSRHMSRHKRSSRRSQGCPPAHPKAQSAAYPAALLILTHSLPHSSSSRRRRSVPSSSSTHPQSMCSSRSRGVWCISMQGLTTAVMELSTQQQRQQQCQQQQQHRQQHRQVPKGSREYPSNHSCSCQLLFNTLQHQHQHRLGMLLPLLLGLHPASTQAGCCRQQQSAGPP
jgi:hypothetical protein